MSLIRSVLESSWARAALLVTLLALIPIQAIPAMVTKTINVDEANHLYRGYIYVETGETTFPQRLNQVIEALFVKWFVDPQEYPEWIGHTNAMSQGDLSLPSLGRQLIFGTKLSDNILFYMRLPFVLLAMATGGLLFRWARELYGTGAAFVALVFYVFSPNILTHCRYALSDFCGAIFMFMTMYCLYHFLMSKRWRWLIISGIGFGLAEVSKESQILLIPVVGLLVLWEAQFDFSGKPVRWIPQMPQWGGLRSWRSRMVNSGLALTGIFLIGGFVIWAVHSFEFDTFVKYGSSRATLGQLGVGGEAGELIYRLVERIPVPAPNYFRGLRDQVIHSTVLGHRAFLDGEYSATGWWYFFFYLYGVKSPLPVLLLVIASALSLLISFRKIRFAEMFLLLPPAIFFLVTARAKLNIGIRHALPVFPFLFVLSVRLFADHIYLSRARAFRWGGGAVAGIACLWVVYGTVRVFPNHEAFFNELVGGPENGFQVAVDSNLDWGQDLPGLKVFMEANGLDEIFLAYYGSSDPIYYRIPHVDLVMPDEGSSDYNRGSQEPKEDRRSGFNVVVRPTEGYVAISATHLQAVFLLEQDEFAWLKKQGPPIAQVGHSILIYEVHSDRSTEP